MNTLFLLIGLFIFQCATAHLTLYCSYPASPQAPLTNRYNLIEALYAGSFKNPEPITSKEEKKNKMHAYKKLPTLNPDAQLNAALQAIKKSLTSYDPLTQTTIASPDTWKNLELFTTASKNRTKSVLGSLKKTYTAAGEVMLTRILMDPTTDLETLTTRQNCIKQLVENQSLYESIHTMLKTFNEEEHNVLSFVFASDPLYSNFLMAQFQQSLFPNFAKLYIPIVAAAAAVGGTAALATAALQSNNSAKEVSEALLPEDFLSEKAKPHIGRALSLIPGLMFLGLSPALIWAASQAAKLIMYAHRRLVGLSTYFKTIEQILSLHNKVSIPGINVLIHNYLDDADKKLEPLRQILKKSTFNWHKNMNIKNYIGSLGTDHTAIIKATLLVPKLQPILFDGMTLIGYLDAYFSLARLIKEQSPLIKARWCFVEYQTNASRPYIQAEDFWHPTIGSQAAVTNSLKLGGTIKPQTIVISGVNQGGKSTIMKSIGLCCLFGQTCGIAPARRFIFTPFSALNTYLNITDDVSSNQSLFSAELARAHTLLSHVKNLPSNQFSLTLLDEICTGTERIEGEALAYSIAEKLGAYQNGITLLASHFPALTELELINKKIYKNMNVLVLKNNDQLTFPYTLNKGKTSQQIAPDLLEKIGLPSIMTQKMRSVLAQPDTYTYRGDN